MNTFSLRPPEVIDLPADRGFAEQRVVSGKLAAPDLGLEGA